MIRSFTPAVTKLFNLIAGDRGRPLSDIASRIDYPNLEDDMRRVCDGGDTVERSVALADENRHYLARVLAYRGAKGDIDGVLLTFVDVTSLVAAEKEQEVLAAELSHRVKNTLAVVSSVADRTLPEGEAKTDLIGRFHALGQTHDLLSKAGWTEAGLRDMILAELAPHAVADGANVTANGPAVMLKPQAALFMALVLHELTTNAVKYGALSAAGGRVEVSWKIGGDGKSRLELDWTESGGPNVGSLPKRGFGTELIERGIRFELQGEAKLELVAGGLRCRIVIPANSQHIIFGSSPESPTREEAAS